MTFILVPAHAEPDGDLQINAWNWRPTLELLLRARLLDGEAVERAAAQDAGGGVTAEQARGSPSSSTASSPTSRQGNACAPTAR
jgi:hypothetical protein